MINFFVFSFFRVRLFEYHRSILTSCLISDWSSMRIFLLMATLTSKSFHIRLILDLPIDQQTQDLNIHLSLRTERPDEVARAPAKRTIATSTEEPILEQNFAEYGSKRSPTPSEASSPCYSPSSKYYDSNGVKRFDYQRFLERKRHADSQEYGQSKSGRSIPSAD